MGFPGRRTAPSLPPRPLASSSTPNPFGFGMPAGRQLDGSTFALIRSRIGRTVRIIARRNTRGGALPPQPATCSVGGMSKRPAKPTADAARALSIPERILLFCVAMGACRHDGHDGDGHDRERSHPARSGDLWPAKIPMAPLRGNNCEASGQLKARTASS